MAISILLQGDLSEGDFSQRLTDFAQGIKENGEWGKEEIKNTNTYCYYKQNDCWPMPTDDMCRTGTLVNDCSDGNPATPLSLIAD